MQFEREIWVIRMLQQGTVSPNDAVSPNTPSYLMPLPEMATRWVVSEAEPGPETWATKWASVGHPALMHERGGSLALVSEASNDVASPHLLRLFGRLHNVQNYVSAGDALICTLRNVQTGPRSWNNAAMDELQSPLMSPDVFLIPHDSDIELIEDTSTCTIQSLDSAISLPPAPSWWLKRPLLRFFAVSDADSDLLAKTQPHIQCVGPYTYQSWWPRASILISALTATPPTWSIPHHNGGPTSSRDMIKLWEHQLLPASYVDIFFNILMQVLRRALRHR